jgi:hypothetical protein
MIPTHNPAGVENKPTLSMVSQVIQNFTQNAA